MLVFFYSCLALTVEGCRFSVDHSGYVPCLQDDSCPNTDCSCLPGWGCLPPEKSPASICSRKICERTPIATI
jgi:hypothetical protein